MNTYNDSWCVCKTILVRKIMNVSKETAQMCYLIENVENFGENVSTFSDIDDIVIKCTSLRRRR